jgi:hypothetical protein
MPQKLALQPADFGASSSVRVQGKFRPGATPGLGAYGLVGPSGSQLVQNFVRGYEIQASDPASVAHVTNYVYEFATARDAQTEYQRWSRQVNGEGTRGAAISAISGKNGSQGLRAMFPATVEGSQTNWHVSVKANFLIILVVDSAGGGQGQEGATVSRTSQNYFDKLSAILIDR